MDLFSYLLGKKSSGGSGVDLSDYFTNTINNKGYAKMVKNIPNTTIVEGTNLNNSFKEYQGETIPLIDTSQVTNMSGMFSYCPNLLTIPLIDTSHVINMQGMFSGSTSLIEIPQLNTSSLGSNAITTMFENCTSLTTIPILNTSNLTTMSNMFANCPNLSDTSLDNILQMCINSNISNTNRKNLSHLGLTATNYPAGRIQALPHYQDFIDAGWTIGYE